MGSTTGNKLIEHKNMSVKKILLVSTERKTTDNKNRAENKRQVKRCKTYSGLPEKEARYSTGQMAALSDLNPGSHVPWKLRSGERRLEHREKVRQRSK
jgi:hypothetical protein